jgi:ATP-dependent DNA helicase RecG
MVGPDTRLDGVIGDVAKKLRSTRGIVTVADLLAFRPRRHTTWDANFSGLRLHSYAVVVAQVKSAQTRRMKARRGEMFTAVITDGRDDLSVTFFKAWGHPGKLVPGAWAVFAGEVTEFNRQRQLTHPDYELIPDPEAQPQEGLLPIYSRTKGIPNWTLKRCVEQVLAVLDDWPEPIPGEVLHRMGLPGSLEAVRALHLPRTPAEHRKALERMKLEEAFLLQTALATRRAARTRDVTKARAARSGGLLDAFDARLPWPLTDAQREVGEQIAQDMARETPMHRLLQGEVGSGKTVVALRAMLAALDSGGQAALLAPTEVLAAQHLRSIRMLLGPLGEGAGLFAGDGPSTGVALLTGSQSTATRRRALLDIASGEAGIVVGTHALLQDRVSFQDLALVVVDEQHRFGVEQRDALRMKGIQPPHVLVMTATPVPRTVAMTVFGEMETTTIRQLPAGRAEIETYYYHEGDERWVERTWARVAEEVRSGHQVYVVCPRIHDDEGGGDDGFDEIVADGSGGGDGEGEENAAEAWDAEEAEAPARPLKAVERVLAELRELPVLAGTRIEALHGQLEPEDKDAVMSAFAAGEVDVLVATTVIEVGVDVPNATVMVILDADRFGVSQLHQLRGRIGRGGHHGLCLLVSSSTGEATQERLKAVSATRDGFELAQLDVEQRREGDILGTGQHGRSSLRYLSLTRDVGLIEKARDEAFAVVSADPTLAGHPALADAVAARLDEEQAAFLERG